MAGIIQQLEKEAMDKGLQVVHKKHGHYQIIGGDLMVNYYPLSKNRAAYVAGTAKGRKHVTPEEAVAMATAAPDKGSKKVKRKQRKPKARARMKASMMEKQKGKCCFCDDEMIVTNDTANPKMATFEHVIPLNRGGLDNPNNIKLSCLDCNKTRGDNMPEIEGNG